jgi:hypothetical protein
MPLIVKPNVRQMRYMRDSPAEDPRPAHNRRPLYRMRWERVIVAGVVVGAVVVGLIVLAAHY